MQSSWLDRSTVEQAHQPAAWPGYRVHMDAQITPSASTDRPNANLAQIVDQALAVCLEHGRETAARFLMSRGAGFALICRVLAEPGRRRAFSLDPLLVG